MKKENVVNVNEEEIKDVETTTPAETNAELPAEVEEPKESKLKVVGKAILHTTGQIAKIAAGAAIGFIGAAAFYDHFLEDNSTDYEVETGHNDYVDLTPNDDSDETEE